MGKPTHQNLKFDHRRFSFILYIIFTGSDSYLCYFYFIVFIYLVIDPIYKFKQITVNKFHGQYQSRLL